MNECRAGGECDFAEDYYGHHCTKCGLFYAYGCAPWDNDEDDFSDASMTDF